MWTSNSIKCSFYKRGDTLQNYADKDADRKTNLLFIKCFQSSKIQGLTSLFWDGNIMYWIVDTGLGCLIRLFHLILPIVL